MNFLKHTTMAIMAVAILGILYVGGVTQIDRAVRYLWFEGVEKNTADHKEVLSANSSFKLGLFRPELPFQYTKLSAIEESLSVQISIVSLYQAWGDSTEHQFKSDVAKSMSRGDFIPLITWEPWLSAFKKYSGKAPDSLCTRIARGEVDRYIRSYARAATRFGKPIFLRVGHEMSNTWYPWNIVQDNTPEQFIAFWKHTVSLFREEGACNVAFVWNPYLPADTVCWPGNDWVDWVGLDIFNYGTQSEGGVWLDFYTVTKILYDAVSQYNKPIIIAEAGCVTDGGNRAYWYRDMFHALAMKNFPLVQSLVLFDMPVALTPMGTTADLSFAGENLYANIQTEELQQDLHIKQYTRRIP